MLYLQRVPFLHMASGVSASWPTVVVEMESYPVYVFRDR